MLDDDELELDDDDELELLVLDELLLDDALELLELLALYVATIVLRQEYVIEPLTAVDARALACAAASHAAIVVWVPVNTPDRYKLALGGFEMLTAAIAGRANISSSPSILRMSDITLMADRIAILTFLYAIFALGY